MDEFDGSDNIYLKNQYKSFRRRLVELYHDMEDILNEENKELQYKSLLRTFNHIESEEGMSRKQPATRSVIS